jgi:CRISPR/Cas system CMR-associated protein Cmr5 small subunit
MSGRHLDHDRARYAYEQLQQEVDRISKAAGDNACKPLGELRSVLLAAPVLLRRHGLLQTLTFWRSKKEREGERWSGERWAAKAIIGWLLEAESTAWALTRSKISAADTRAATAHLTTLQPATIALLEAEAESMAGWLKRAVEGHWIDRGCGKEKEQRNGQEAPAATAGGGP